MAFNTFPNPNSIPPASFYNLNGLSDYLNKNPAYKHYFINYPQYYPDLYTSTFVNNGGVPFSNGDRVPDMSNYNLENVPLPFFVTILSNSQLNKYKRQLNLFVKIYSFNYNVYNASISSNTVPMYYNKYSSYQELFDYKASIKLINTLYPFDAMAYGTNENGSTLGWIVPFPL